MTARLVDTRAGKGLVDDDAPELTPLVIDLAHARKLSPDDDLLKALGGTGRTSRNSNALAQHGRRTVVDATAGIGRDALALVAAGFEVTCCERAPLVVELWRDALARHQPRGLHFVAVDAIAWLHEVAGTDRAPESVFLDPMYPHADRKALQQREMRLLRAAAGDDFDVDALFAAARRAARSRVVVKRPKKAPPLAADVAHAWAGASTRLDLYLKF